MHIIMITRAAARAHERCHEAVDCREEDGLLQKVGKYEQAVLREPYFFFLPFLPLPPLPASSRPSVLNN